MKVKCTICGIEQERLKNKATCFECKKKRAQKAGKEYYKKKLALKVKNDIIK